MAVISGQYGGAPYEDPEMSGNYLDYCGLDAAATNDPEGFWGQFAMYLPNSFLFNLQTMRMEWSEYGGLTPADLRELLDNYLE